MLVNNEDVAMEYKAECGCLVLLMKESPHIRNMQLASFCKLHQERNADRESIQRLADIFFKHQTRGVKMVTQAEVDKFIEVSGRTGVLDRHSQIGIAIARECLDSRNRVASLEAERDRLKKRLETTEEASAIFEKNSKHCSEEFEKRLKAEKERDRAMELLREWMSAHPISSHSVVYRTHKFLANVQEDPPIPDHIKSEYDGLEEVAHGVFIDPGNAAYIVDSQGEVVSWTADEWMKDQYSVTAALNAVAIAVARGSHTLRLHLTQGVDHEKGSCSS